jgi:hypothetical protein
MSALHIPADYETMNYNSLFTPHHVAILHDWITEIGELYVFIDLPHSGASGYGYLVHSLEDIRNLIVQQTHPEIEIDIFREIMFPIRGKDYATLLARAVREIPDNQYYRIVALASYPNSCRPLADGKGHNELRDDIAKLDADQEIGIGVFPFDLSHQEFDSLYRNATTRLNFLVHKNLNNYSEFIANPAKYRDAIEQWSKSIEQS